MAAAEVLNQRLPLDLLTQVAQSTALPENLRQKAIPAAWARAVLLGNVEIAQKLAADAAKARPEMASFLNFYAAAGTDDERRFAAVFAIVHFPGLRPFVDSAYPRTTAFAKIDNYRDNWWCADVGGSPKLPNFYKQNTGRDYYAAELERRDPTVEADYPAFLNEGQRAQAQKEWQQLLSLGLPMNYFSQVTLDWAHLHPDDPRVPEALHYAWRTQRWGCEDGKVHNYSRDLFKLLHRRYPTSEWTRKTTVWW